MGLDKLTEFSFIQKEESVDKVKQIRSIHEELGGLTYTREEELAILFELARGIGHYDGDDGYCLDLGTYYGLSGLVMAQGIKESQIYTYPVLTIDSYPFNPRKLEKNELVSVSSDVGQIDKEWINKVGCMPMTAHGVAIKIGLCDYLVQTIHDSVKFLQLFQGSIRLAFIDSSHDFATCFNEASLVKQLLVKGGKIVFHDSNLLGVPKVLKSFEGEAFTCDRMTILEI